MDKIRLGQYRHHADGESRSIRQPAVANGDSKPSAVEAAIRTVVIETAALQALHEALLHGSLRREFDRAIALISRTRGRLVVSGMGKSGHIARKVASTLASVGTPSFFLHPTEASHGDLGMITADDAVLVFSWSGETVELSDVVTFAKRIDVPLIAVTSSAESSLARRATISLLLPPVQEACPNRLAPTSSTILQLAIGDALAVAMTELRGFSAANFRMFHPRGKLGAQLITVGDIMSVGEAVPRVSHDATILDAIFEMSRKRFGVTAVIDSTGSLVGAFTDGDLRRSMASGQVDDLVCDNMTASPRHVPPTLLASEALEIMNEGKFSQLFVCDDGQIAGIVHLHDIVKARVF